MNTAPGRFLRSDGRFLRSIWALSQVYGRFLRSDGRFLRSDGRFLRSEGRVGQGMVGVDGVWWWGSMKMLGFTSIPLSLLSLGLSTLSFRLSTLSFRLSSLCPSKLVVLTDWNWVVIWMLGFHCCVYLSRRCLLGSRRCASQGWWYLLGLTWWKLEC